MQPLAQMPASLGRRCRQRSASTDSRTQPEAVRPLQASAQRRVTAAASAEGDNIVQRLGHALLGGLVSVAVLAAPALAELDATVQPLQRDVNPFVYQIPTPNPDLLPDVRI
jgi:hypothetical protein